MSPGQPMSVLVKGNTLLITGCPSLGATFGFRDFSELFRESDTAYWSKLGIPRGKFAKQGVRTPRNTTDVM